MNIANESTCRLPYEIVEMIIGHLIRDRDALKACSLVCRSWYAAAVQRIHHTIILGEKGPDKPGDHLKPLSRLHELGLTLLVKQITVYEWLSNLWFTPQAFSLHDLRYFSAFANVQELRLEYMDISSFVPGAERYFGHFSPTLRSITLLAPCCTPRQLSYFLSLFPNLDNVYLFGISPRPPKSIIPDTKLAQFSAPKLRGDLQLRGSHWAETWTHLITSRGDLRFNYMSLYRVGSCASILLGACAETLETLQFSLADDSAKFSSLSSPGYNLSPLKVLRSLRINLVSTGACYTTLLEIFSTIISPVFSELVLEDDVDVVACLSSDAFLETLRTMNGVRPFKLVFLLEDRYLEGLLTEALDSMTAKGFLDFLDSPPTIRHA